MKFIDITGKRFNRWLVLYYDVNRQKWFCKCDCGTESFVWSGDLRENKSKSCGCWDMEVLLKRSITHNKSKTPEYRVWKSMKKRCYNKNDTGYKNYGGRGVIICERWLDKENGFINFLQDLGERPSPKHTLDRVNNNGNYEPKNCRWATKEEQTQNTRRNVLDENLVLLIREDYKNGFKISEITKKYKIHRSAIDCVVYNKTWKNIKN